MLMNGPSFYLPGYIAHDQTPSMPLVLRLEGVGAGRGRGAMRLLSTKNGTLFNDATPPPKKKKKLIAVP